MMGAPLETITTPIAEVHLRADGIVFVAPTHKSEHGFAEADEALRAIAKLSRGRRVPIIVDLRHAGNPTQAARNHYMGPDGARIYSAIGLLVESPFSKVLGNFIIKLGRGSIPTQLFHSEDEAVEWLKRYLE